MEIVYSEDKYIVKSNTYISFISHINLYWHCIHILIGTDIISL